MQGNKRETFWFLQEKVICWKFEELIPGIQVLQFLYCKNLTSLLPVWSRQALPHCFSLSSHLVVGTDGDIIERFGSGAVVPWQGAEVPTRLQSLKHLGPPCPHSHGCCFLPVPLDISCYRTGEITFQMGSCLFSFSFRNVSWVGCRGFQRKFPGASLWTMTPCSRMMVGTMQACRGPCPWGLATARIVRSELLCLAATGSDGTTLYSVALS